MPEPDARGIFFDSRLLHEPSYEYVCWLDVMGTANQMLRSLPIAANFIFKLQCAVLESFEEIGSPQEVSLYPVMDGVYITSARRDPLQKLLRQTFCRVALTFLREEKPFHQFLIRAAVAFGPIYHGRDVHRDTSHALARNEIVRDSMLMGYPMAQAYRAERDAPPFGIAIDASARAFAPYDDRPFRFLWLDWFRHCTPQIDPAQMLAHLQVYFEWQTKHTNMTGYEPNRIRHHVQLVEEFFTSGG